MASIAENSRIWSSEYDWSKGGDEWSAAFGGTEFLWWGALFPRVRRFLSAGTILEIAPGYGRCSQFLADHAQRLILVDLSERCIQACKSRFAELDHVEYHVNDGESLAMVPAGDVDFAFSYDSLVHVEGDQVDAYVRQLAQKLAPEGVAFIHHSNLAMYVDGRTKALPFENLHWRSTTMSAARMQGSCAAAGLCCFAQEMLGWGRAELTDCFSLVARSDSCWARPCRVRKNDRFMEEVRNLAAMAGLYGAS